MKKTYRVEISTADESALGRNEVKALGEPFKSSKQLKATLARALLTSYNGVGMLRDVNTANYIKIRVVQVDNEETQ